MKMWAFVLLLPFVFSCSENNTLENTISGSNPVSKFGVEAGKTGAIHWVAPNEVEKMVSEEPKKVMFFFYAEWCENCQQMLEITFQDKDVIDYLNTHFYSVKVDAETGNVINFRGRDYKGSDFSTGRKKHELATTLIKVPGNWGYPAITFMNEDLKIITSVIGNRSPENFFPLLEFMETEEYLKNKPFEEYLKNRKMQE